MPRLMHIHVAMEQPQWSAGDFEAAPTRRLDSAGCHLLDAPTQASFTKTPLPGTSKCSVLHAGAGCTVAVATVGLRPAGAESGTLTPRLNHN